MVSDFSNQTVFEIRNISPKKYWEFKNGRWSKTMGRRPDIDPETKRLRSKIKMTGITIINDVTYDIEFSIDESTFEKDIKIPRDLMENGNYTIYDTFIKPKGTYFFEDSTGKSVKYDLKKDTIYGGVAIFNG